MFTTMLETLKMNTISILSRIQVRSQEEVEEAERQRQALAEQEMQNLQSGDEVAGENGDEPDYANMKISRNEPCPCGSGKKFKHCHGSKTKIA